MQKSHGNFLPEILVLSLLCWTLGFIPVPANAQKTMLKDSVSGAWEKKTAKTGDDTIVTVLGIKKQMKALPYSFQYFSAQEMTGVSDENVINFLGGRIAGLDLIRSNGGVGSPVRAVLRGNRSISGNNQPLFVVDCVPVNNSCSSTFGEGGGTTFGDGISNINPEDIESITVLKGPSGSAIYGMRGNNGAIVITTKKGMKTKGIGVSYSMHYNVETPVILTRFQNVYGQGFSGIYSKNSEFDWGPKMEGQKVNHWTPDENSPKYGTTYPYSPHPDNLKDFLQTGSNMTNSLALSAGNKKVYGYFSFTNTNSRGIMPGNNLKRNNLNLRAGGELFRHLNFDAKFTYFHQDVKNRVPTGDNFLNPMRAILRQPSNISDEEAQTYYYRNLQGAILQNYWNPHSNGGENPYWIIDNTPEIDTRDRVLTVGSLKYEFIEGLSLQIRLSGDFIFDSFEQSLFNDTYMVADRGNYRTSAGKNRERNSDFLLNYEHTFANVWSIHVAAGGNMYSQKCRGNGTSNGSLLVPDLFTITNAAALSASEYGADRKLNSLYGFAALGFRNYLFLDFTARNEWSSDLPKKHWSNLYPSAGISLIVSDMIRNFPAWINLAKIRISQASAGNYYESYQNNQVFISDFNAYNYKSSGMKPDYEIKRLTKPSSDTKPEKTVSGELGIDFRLFNDRLGLNFTAYKSNSKNQNLLVYMQVASGYDSKMISDGNIQNKGIEATIDFMPGRGPFVWDIAVNYAKNNNLVVKLTDEMTRYPLTGRQWMSTTIVQAGYEYGEILVKKFLRNADGRVIVDARGLPKVSDGQTEFGGNYNPDWIGGIENTFSFKGFDLGFLIDIRQGGVIYSFTEANLASDGFSDYTLKGRDGFVVDGVVQTLDYDGHVISENENTTSITSEAYWQSLGGRNTPTGEPFRRDASNARLRSLVFGYTHSFSNSPGRNFRISLEGRNLFFLYNKAGILDPNLSSGITNIQGVEGFGLPTTRSYGVNLNVTF